MKLSNYDDWKHCITVMCGIPLTRNFIQERLTELNNPKNHQTRQFKKTWGDDHHKKVISWFEKAQAEVL